MVSLREKLRVALAILLTLLALHLVPYRILLPIPLLFGWWFLFRPVARAEMVTFGIAGVFFLIQNYITLKAGLFEFRDKDVLLMPYWEPFLWGFYFLVLRRFVSGRTGDAVRFSATAIVGVAVTSAAFSLFGYDPNLLLAATLCSTAVLFILFHEPADLQYAGAALALGLIIEVFGVSTGLWWYPAPDFLGIPYWFATMWISVGVLGRRFLIPTSEWLAGKMVNQRA